jgi:hypothetical protein
LKYHRKKNLKNKLGVEYNDFVSGSVRVQKCDVRVSKTVRDVFGFIYGVAPELIYSEDTPESLGLLGQSYDPYAFEMVVGTCNRLGIVLTESEVDTIGKQIYQNAKNVEDVMCIINEEIKDKLNNEKLNS